MVCGLEFYAKTLEFGSDHDPCRHLTVVISDRGKTWYVFVQRCP